MRNSALQHATPAAHDTTASTHAFCATVLSVSGSTCRLHSAQGECDAALATHLPGVVAGQQVMVAGDAQHGYLVMAAWPHPDAPAALQWQDGCLRIQANALQLDAVSRLELVCGDARLSLQLGGQVALHGNDILSSAVGSQRIEGGSIDLN